MEVHHHAHHPKNWKEYITEFIMLFAAVTLGFLAENIREHQIINHKTNQNLQSIILDLKKDSVLIQERLQEYTKASILLEKLNTLSIHYHSSKISKDEFLDSALNINNDLVFGTSFYINNSSYKNTISSGSFSNISSLELKRTISDYYEVYGAKLNDNNRILDDVVEFYTIHTLPKPGGRLGNARSSEEIKNLISYYKKSLLFNSSLLDKEFIIYNQKAKDRVDIYLLLMTTFNQKNAELLKLLAANQHE
jgi:hypothetical protein